MREQKYLIPVSSQYKLSSILHISVTCYLTTINSHKTTTNSHKTIVTSYLTTVNSHLTTIKRETISNDLICRWVMIYF